MIDSIFHKQARVLQAMAHPKRLEIINLLRDKPLTVSQIQDMLALRQAYLSQHLMILRAAGVLTWIKRGKEHYYQVAHAKFIEASDAIREVIGGAEEQDLKDLVPLSKDPVCGMRVSRKTAGAVCEHQGQTYFFCATGCSKKFIKQPEKFV